MEAFALATDRAKFLETLIPGTEDYYHYHALHALHEGRQAEVRELLERWYEKHRKTSRYQEVERRLLLSREDPEAFEALRQDLSLLFQHQRQVDGQQTDYPTELDPGRVDRDAFERAASSSTHLNHYADPALEWLPERQLSTRQRRELLDRLTLPDHPALLGLIVADMREDHKDDPQFGGRSIHARLTRAQLEALLYQLPNLRKQDAFVQAYLARLRPATRVDLEVDLEQRRALLERVWAFVETLEPAFHSLKLHVLYHWLDMERRQGVYDRERFLRYLALPRNASYVDPDYLKRDEFRYQPVGSLGTHFASLGLPPSPSDDEPLVRDFLTRFFAEADDWKPWDVYVRDSYLKRLFATTKILLGQGDGERWHTLLNDPGYYQELKDRVDLEFALDNPTWFPTRGEVALDVHVKHVDRLTVKVFRINALNYALSQGGDVDAAIDLDGMIASEETVHTYDEPPLRRVRRTYRFPALEAPGTYVIELLGGGRSSRALVRKGKLRFVERMGAAGHVFTILDEENQLVPGASLWLAGREYRADDEGELHVPYSTDPGPRQVVLQHGDLVTVDAFQHRAEHYTFEAGLFVEREALLARQEAQVVIRPRLLLRDQPVSLSLIEEPTLTIEATDLHGVSSSRELPLELHDDRETVQTFRVSPELAALTLRVRGRVKRASTGATQDLAVEQRVELNGIDGTDAVQSLHRAHTAGGHVVYLLGKSGEPRAHVPINVGLYHREFKVSLHMTLQTDAAGRVGLGQLPGIVRLEVATGDGVSRDEWTLRDDRSVVPQRLHAAAGEQVRLPYMGRRTAVDRDAFALLELRHGVVVHDHREAALHLEGGYLVVSGLAAGDYELWLKESDQRVTLLVERGVERAGWIAGETWLGERRYARPLQIAAVEPDGQGLRVRLGQASQRARLHVFATRYAPAYDAFGQLGLGLLGPRASKLSRSPTTYQSGRDIGDEYRYVLERRLEARFPGNMLTRPGLLLNPWAIRKTDTEVKSAGGGGHYGAGAGGARREDLESGMHHGLEGDSGAAFANLDFLAGPAGVALNLRPDEAGVVRVPAEVVAHANQVRLVAVDPVHTVVRDVRRPEVTRAHQDLSLQLALDPDQHFVERKQATPLRADQALAIEDITTSQVEVYDSLSRVYQLFTTLSGDADLATFKFVLRWPQLPVEERRARYSEHACHELNFFLSRKDPTFFREVVQPYLRHKREQTFMDHYLLEQDLTGYLEPWAYGRLNVVERILLAGRIDGDAGPRHVTDLFDLLVPDVDEANRLFRTALRGSALETEDGLGFGAAADKAKEMAMERLVRSSMMAPAGAAMPAMAPPPAPRSEMKKMARKRAAPQKAMAMDMMDEECAAEAEACFDELDDAFMADSDALFEARDRKQEKELAARQELRQLFRALDPTEELGEQQYYRRTPDRIGPDLVTVNAFWRDFALHHCGGQGPFLSGNVAEAHRSFTEMLLALAVLDLPFEAGKPTVAYEGAAMRLTPTTPTVVFHEEIKPAEAPDESTPILVSQNYFRKDDRYRYERGQTVEKYVRGELLVHVVYQCQVVLTNPTSSPQQLDLLLQIPRGAIPVEGGFFTKGVHVHLSAFGVQTYEYAFYFPRTGTWTHFPVHVSRHEEPIAAAAPRRLLVVERLTEVDRTSWAWISQHAEPEAVLAFLEAENVEALDLGLIAWRMRERDFYERALTLLARRHAYHEVLWSYALHHRDRPRLRQFLLHQDHFLRGAGELLEGPFVEIDPVRRGWYDHREYRPLVNARAHRLGAERKILNDRFREQYARFTRMLCYRPRLTDEDWLEATYYLFLQDRISEALDAFDRVDPAGVRERLQYDYLSCYVAFYRQQPQAARELAQRHAEHPVDRWRKLFDLVLAQLEEIDGASRRVADPEDHAQQQGALASSEPVLELAVEDGQVVLTHEHLEACTLNFYLMDIELLFSRQPFVQQEAGRFAWIAPNATLAVELSGGGEQRVPLPAALQGKNVVVEATASGLRRSQAYFAHALRVQMIERYGQVRVGDRQGEPLPGAYVKVYARDGRGEPKFYKDGYTDLRGRFDYASLSTSELDGADRFSVLVLSDAAGAVIREAAPPGR